ncbi:hypothetical protein F5883DRAFT_180324 [Diaporthe sp. PMI_573]|nr:hypothetical protein F5883DRAFT_180324 [Diaporthaceae sp. PMI_573]
MAPSTNSDNPAALLSTTPSIANSDLDTTTDFNRSDINREAATDTSSSADYTGYEGIDWNRLSGYCISKHRRRQRTGWVWEHGFDIEKDGSGRRFWLWWNDLDSILGCLVGSPNCPGGWGLPEFLFFFPLV